MALLSLFCHLPLLSSASAYPIDEPAALCFRVVGLSVRAYVSASVETFSNWLAVNFSLEMRRH